MAGYPVVLLDAPLRLDSNDLRLLRVSRLRNTVLSDARVLQLRFNQTLAAGATWQVSHTADRTLLSLRQQVLFGPSRRRRGLLRVHMLTTRSIGSRHGPPIIDSLYVIANGVRDSLIRRLLTKVSMELVLRRFAWLPAN